MMIVLFRFFNHRKVYVVAKDLDTAKELLDPTQIADIKTISCRKCLMKV